MLKYWSGAVVFSLPYSLKHGKKKTSELEEGYYCFAVLREGRRGKIQECIHRCLHVDL